MFSAFPDPQAFPHATVRILSFNLFFLISIFWNLYFLLKQRRESQWMLFFTKNSNNCSSTFFWIHNILLTFKQFFKNVSFFNKRFMLNAKFTAPASYFQASCSSESATASTASLNSSFICISSHVTAQMGAGSSSWFGATEELELVNQIRCRMCWICFSDVEFTIDFSGENAKMRALVDHHERRSSLKVVDLRTVANHCIELFGTVDAETTELDAHKSQESTLQKWRE